MINAKRLPRADTSAFATIIAIILAVLATVAVYLYLQGVREESTTAPSKTTVIVAKENIPAGSNLSELLAAGAFTTMAVPNDLVVPGAVTDLAQLEATETADAILAGEQIPAARVAGTVPGGTMGIPRGFAAVSFPIDASKVAGGNVREGDKVAIFGTFDDVPQFAGDAGTAVLVPSAEILKIGGAESEGSAGISRESGELVLTLALRGKDAQKVVFAQEEGAVWMALLSPTGRPLSPGLIGLSRVIP